MASESINFSLFATDNASKVFDKVGKSAERTESRFSKVSRSLSLLGGVAAAGGAAVAGLGVAGGIMGLKIAAGNEQAAISFTTMLGSAKKADAFLRDLQKFAAKTPFEFPELQTAASSLISAGVQAKKVIPIMTTLGDVTSGMGTGSEGVKRATIALQQMSAAGRITGEDLNQLRDAGVPVFDLLASATGRSKEAVAKLAQAGKLGKADMEDLFKALETGKGLERFNGLMEKQSQSLTGLWSTFKDTLGQGLAKVIEPLIPLLKEGLGGAAEFLAAKLPAISDWMTNTGVPAVKSFASWLRDDLWPALSLFGSSVMKGITGAISGFVDGMGGDGQAKVGGFQKAVGSIGDVITKVVLPAIGKFIEVTLPAMGKAIGMAINFSLDMASAYAGLAVSVTKSFNALASAAIDSIGSILHAADKVRFLFGPAMAASIHKSAEGFDDWAGDVKGGLKKAESGLVVFKDAIDDLREKARTMGRNVGNALGAGVAAGISASSGMAIEQARQTVNKINAMMNATAETSSPSKVTERIGRYIGQGLILGMTGETANIEATAETLVGKIQDAFKGLKTKVDTHMIATLRSASRQLTALGEKRDALFQNFSQVATGIVGSGAISGLGAGQSDDDGNPLAVSAGSVISDMQTRVSNAASFAANLLKLKNAGLNKEALATLARDGVEQAGAVAAALATAGASAIAQINALQTQLASAATSAAKVGSVAMYEAGVQAGKGLAQGFASQKKLIEDEMLKIANAMAAKMRRALRERSPSQVFDAIGRNVGLGLAQGIDATHGRVLASTESLMSVPSSFAGASAGRGAGPSGSVINVTVNALDPVGAATAVKGALEEWVRRNGPLPARMTA